MWSVIATSAGGGHSLLRPPAALVRIERLAAEAAEGLDRAAHGAGVAAFVIMAAALKQRDPPPLDLADDQPSGVAFDARRRKAGDVAIGDCDRVARLVGEGAEAGAEHDGERRQARKTLRSQGGDSGVAILAGHDSSAARRPVSPGPFWSAAARPPTGTPTALAKRAMRSSDPRRLPGSRSAPCSLSRARRVQRGLPATPIPALRASREKVGTGGPNLTLGARDDWLEFDVKRPLQIATLNAASGTVSGPCL